MKNLKLMALLLVGGLGFSAGPSQADVGADPGISQGYGGASGSAMKKQKHHRKGHRRHSGGGECCGEGGSGHHHHHGKSPVERTSRETALEADEWMKRATARETSAAQNASAGGDEIMGAIAGEGSSEVQRHSDSKDPAFERSGPGRDRR